MSVKRGILELPGSLLGSENPLPVFRDPDHNPKRKAEGFSEEQMNLYGYCTGSRVLPYKMQDNYTRDRSTVVLKTFEMENENLKAVFLADYGSRLYSLYSKKSGRDLYFKNPVFQPANLAIRDAWMSGGIEWNASQFGHSFITLDNVHLGVVRGEDGEEFLRAYEYERCKGLYWQIDFHLPKGAEQLFIHTRLMNVTDQPMSTYWWTNIAAREDDSVRVLAGTADVIYTTSEQRYRVLPDGTKQEIPSVPGLMVATKMPHLENPDNDASYSLKNIKNSTEYFFQYPEGTVAPWEAAAYGDGYTVYDMSTANLRFHKMFCWGHGPGGRQWCNFLAEDGKGDYLELQAGISPTQLHGFILEPKTEVAFTQCFGELIADYAKSGQECWKSACDYIADEIHAKITPDTLYAYEEVFHRDSFRAPERIVSLGHGWAALEQHRVELMGGFKTPEWLTFPETAINAEQLPWLGLLENGVLAAPSIEAAPVSYMVDDNWFKILSESVKKTANVNWYSMYHYGVMLAERGENEAAVKAFDGSLACKPNPWAYRCIAVLKLRMNDNDTACEYYEKACSFDFVDRYPMFWQEYLALLNKLEKYEQCWEKYNALSAELRDNERIALYSCIPAIELRHLDHIPPMFEREYSNIREGETSVSDIWFKYHACLKAGPKGDYHDFLDEVKTTCPPPSRFDFRMTT